MTGQSQQHQNPYQVPWVAAITRAPQRTRHQTAANQRRRAAALESAKDGMGSYVAVAEVLGTSRQDLNSIKIAAAGPDHHEPLPDHVDIALPQAGGQVWTTTEWEPLAGERRIAAARLTHAHWRAQALVLAQMTRSTERHLEALGEVALDGEWTDHRDLQAQVAAAGAPELARGLFTRDDVDAHLVLLSDLAAAYRAQAEQAWKQEGVWQHRAQGEPQE